MARRVALVMALVAGCTPGTAQPPGPMSSTAVAPPDPHPPSTTTTIPPVTTTTTVVPSVATSSERPAAPPPEPVPAAPVEAGGAATHRASWYARGARTASGERFDPDGLTAAHRELAFGTRLRVCHDGCVVVTVNDRGPAKWTGRDIDLSRAAFAAIAPLGAGVVDVTWEAA